ncbi:MAG TPA: adenine deaminase C-terminal domain-containing protein [Chloroflexota bacterium]|nr:adenine deaminase C-terminal domain-containing protein [Chloroflexota bacterium]
MVPEQMTAHAARARALMAVALGESPADLVVRGGTVLNVFTAELIQGCDVAVKAGRIAYVGPDAGHVVGPDTEIVEANGQFVVPGLIDGHTHVLETRYSLAELLRYAVPGGTTTIITETGELATVLGRRAVDALLDALVDQPVKVFMTLPPLIGLAPFIEAHAPDLEAYERWLRHPRVLGLGEVYWGPLVRSDRRPLELVAATVAAERRAEGHSAGARGSRLIAYAAAGISSCHEPVTADEARERLRLGLYTMVREGEIRQDLAAMAPLWRDGTDLRRLVLVTDGQGPDRLLRLGYLDHCVRRAIELGLEPARAIQMVTLNVAEHFGRDRDLGAVAPGRCADLLLVPDLRDFRPTLVLSDGRVVARDGTLTVEPRQPSFPRHFYSTLKRPRIVRPADFAVPAPDGGPIRARAIELVTNLVTREEIIELRPVDGYLCADPKADLVKIASLDRGRRTDELFVGFLRGYGLRRGAVATSMTWDSQSVIVIGADDRDMALAACRLLDTQGGVSVCAGGALVAEFEARLGGLVSEAPLEEIASDLCTVEVALRELGCSSATPVLTADTMTTGAIPHLRITDRGYVRLRDAAMLGLTADSPSSVPRP